MLDSHREPQMQSHCIMGWFELPVHDYMQYIPSDPATFSQTADASDFYLLLRPCLFQISVQFYSHIKKKIKSQKYISIVTFYRNWSRLAFQSQQSHDNAVCRRRFNTLLTCGRTVFPGLCKHDTSQSNTNPLCLIRALLAHCDWITPIIWEHICLLYRLDSLTTRLSQWKT